MKLTSTEKLRIVVAVDESRSQIVSQITLRQIPDVLDKQLRSLAGKNKTSLNKIVLSLLMKDLGLSVGSSGKKRDLTDLCGTWSKQQYDEFMKNTEIFNDIDSEIWE